MKEVEYKIKYAKFDYINDLADYFDMHRECELIAFSVGKNCNCFFAIYKDFSNRNEEKDPTK